MSAFSVVVTNNHATPVGYELPDVEGLRFTTVSPGGCGVLSFRLPPQNEALAVPPYLGFDYKVEVWDAGVCIWSGVMDPPSLVMDARDSYHWEVTATGWGVLLSAQFDNTQNVQNQQTSTVVSSAITNLVPEFARTGFATSITATGFTLSNTAAINLAWLTGVAQITWAGRFGDSSDARQVFTVYPDDDGTVWFTFAPQSTTPDYSVQIRDAAGARLGGNRHAYANRATVRYNGAASSVSSNDTTLQGEGPAGVDHIHELLWVLDELTQSADATQAANALLEAHKALRLAPNGPMVLSFSTTVHDADGQLVKPWRIRAGNVMLLTDVLATEAPDTNLALWPQFLIAETDVNEEAQTVTLTPESFETYMERQVSMVYALLQGRHTL